MGLIAAYVIGSFPSAYLAGRILKGVDLRSLGSGNLGATNVYRNLGLPAALAVLALDAAKGAIPTYVLPRLLVTSSGATDAALWWSLAFGAAAVAGHAKPIFLLWRGGGKGVATAGGVFAVVTPWAVLAVTILLFTVVFATRYMSLASVTAAVAFPLFVLATRGSTPVLIASIMTGVFIVWTNRGNIRRLRAGTEQRLMGREPRP
jgi:glycerol-3-phosphate acyltransferase PlsY